MIYMIKLIYLIYSPFTHLSTKQEAFIAELKKIQGVSNASATDPEDSSV